MTLPIMYIIAGLLTLAWNLYIQFVIADNWPPTDRSRIAWDAVATLAALCLICWPLILVLMWLDNQRHQYRQALARKNRRMQVLS